MGSSGSGKSTLMNLIGALDRPTGGQYLLDGIDVSKLDRDRLADIRNEKIGFVFQGFNLLSRTSALENVEMPMLYNRERIHAHEQLERALQALELVGSPIVPTIIRTSFPVASNNASPSPARW